MNAITASDIEFLQQAIVLAQLAESQGEVPVGAIVVYEEKIIASGWNQPIKTQDPTAHAEIMAIREASQRLTNYRLTGSTLYVTLEPCAMCAGAMLQARIERLVFGAFDPRAGAVTSVFAILQETKLNHRIKFDGGILAEECGALLRNFFLKRR